jgi:UDP-N-acetylmuramoyl-tripeptide--D-alanyl-D-alanine ligase
MLQIKLNDCSITSLSWDTRTIKPGDWYIPNIGDTFDGHDFINLAFEKGAVGAFCQRDRVEKVDVKWHDKILFYDTVDQALHDLVSAQVAAVRTQNKKAKIVTVTGTSGKTTTREMMVFMFSKFGKVLSAQTNFNTFWGNAHVLSQYDGQDFLVLETGLGTQNEVKIQNEAIKPDLSLLLNIGHAHAGLAGGIEGVYAGKKAIVDVQVKANRPVVVNIDDARIGEIKKEYQSYDKLFTVGKNTENFISYIDANLSPEGSSFTLIHKGEEKKVTVKALGEKYVYNAMLAISAGVLLGNTFNDCCAALEGYDSFTGRFQVVKLSATVTLINDAYNANPTSFENGLSTFAAVWKKPKYEHILVLGDMAELGDLTVQLHESLGLYIQKLGLTVDLYVGQYAQLIGAKKSVQSVDEVVPELKSLINQKQGKQVVIYCKSSNSKKIYTLVDAPLVD